MRKSSLALAALTLAVLAGSSLGISFAANAKCSGTKASPASAHDPFGSCEDGGGFSSAGNVRCGSGGRWQTLGGQNVEGAGSVPTFAKVNADPEKGVQVCNDGTGNPKTLPAGDLAAPYIIQGRVTAYKDANGNVVIAADGDKDNTTNLNAGAAGWNRVDVRPNDASCKIRMRRGTGSDTYWKTSSGAPSTPNGSNGVSDTCTQGYIP